MGRREDNGPAEGAVEETDADQDDQGSLVSSVTDDMPLSAGDAEDLTHRIKVTIGNVSYQLDVLASLVAKAKAGEAHTALGYKSWTAYVATEFAGCSLRLDRDDRRELVAHLSGEGMSTRAIGPVVGADQSTVARDLSGDADASPEPRIVHGRDGKDYTVSPRAELEALARRPSLSDCLGEIDRNAHERWPVAVRALAGIVDAAIAEFGVVAPESPYFDRVIKVSVRDDVLAAMAGFDHLRLARILGAVGDVAWDESRVSKVFGRRSCPL